jgi:hypothetical protein
VPAVDVGLALGREGYGLFLRLVGEVVADDHEGLVEAVADVEGLVVSKGMVLSHRRTAQAGELFRPHRVQPVQCVPKQLVVAAAQPACGGSNSGMICSM